MNFNGHLVLEGLNFSRVLKDFKFSRDERSLKGIKNPKLHSPRSKFFKVSRVLKGFNFKGLKG